MRYALPLLPLLLLCRLCAQDTVYAIPLKELQLTEGTLPKGVPVFGDELPAYARVAAGAAYLSYPGAQDSGPAFMDPAQLELVVRTSSALPVEGMLAIPGDRPADPWLRLRFRIPATTASASADRFSQAQAAYARMLLQQQVSGAAWFRHLAGTTSAHDQRGQLGGDADLEESYALFGGGRAMSENLQLDRPLTVAPGTDAPRALSSLKGVSIAPLDYTRLVIDPHPMVDALAERIPADQHALFFPSFTALTESLNQADTLGTEFASLAGEGDAGSCERYQRQLCLEMDSFSRTVGPAVITSVACTGSDPYLRVGSDVALLFASAHAELLQRYLTSRQVAAITANAAVTKAVSGSMGGVSYLGAVSDDRSICSYLATIQGVVVVTNSLAQLKRLIAVGTPELPALSDAPEYRFFRDRYRSTSQELAFLVISDSCIRRWCSPRWRIADSRRTRAAAVLAELQARRIDHQVEGDVAALSALQGIDLGSVSYVGMNAHSSSYGSLGFMTPINECTMDQVTSGEAAAYDHFRDNYQRSWGRWFDPVAMRLYRTAHGLGIDLSVLPLISDSSYQPLLDVIGHASISSAQGDRHAGSLLHAVMAIDQSSATFRQGTDLLSGMTTTLGLEPLSWMGSSVALYADEDPIWSHLEVADGSATSIERNLAHLPIALNIAVKNPLKLMVFLTTMHGLIDQSAPGLVTWDTRTYAEQPYVKISTTEAASQMLQQPDQVSLFYVATPEALIFSLREDVLQRAIDRLLARRAAAKNPGTAAPPAEWLGEHLACTSSPQAPAIIAGWFADDLRKRARESSWKMLPILNEWHRLFPGQDPMQVQEALWGTRPSAADGGSFVWNESWQTMESTVYGHPGEPRPGPLVPSFLAPLAGCETGLTFQALDPPATSGATATRAPVVQAMHQFGLRARIEWTGIVPTTKPAP
jgi:hypothetical protein